MKPSGLRSSEPPTRAMVHAACSPVAERPPNKCLRVRRFPLNAAGPVTVGMLGVVALAVIFSAVTVVSREPFGTSGVVLPTRTVTTTTAPPSAPASQAPIPPPVTRAPTVAPPAIAPTNVQPTVPPPAPPPAPPKVATTRSLPTHSEPSSVHPTTHRAFPQETTDFLGPPGTNG